MKSVDQQLEDINAAMADANGCLFRAMRSVADAVDCISCSDDVDAVIGAIAGQPAFGAMIPALQRLREWPGNRLTGGRGAEVDERVRVVNDVVTELQQHADQLSLRIKDVMEQLETTDQANQLAGILAGTLLPTLSVAIVQGIGRSLETADGVDPGPIVG